MFVWAKNFREQLKSSMPYSLKYFFISVEIFTRVASAPLKIPGDFPKKLCPQPPRLFFFWNSPIDAEIDKNI